MDGGEGADATRSSAAAGGGLWDSDSGARIDERLGGGHWTGRSRKNAVLVIRPRYPIDVTKEPCVRLPPLYRNSLLHPLLLQTRQHHSRLHRFSARPNLHQSSPHR